MVRPRCLVNVFVMKSIIAGLLQGRFLGHPLHPVFVHIPLGLWPAALVLDLVTFLGTGSNMLVRLSFFAIVGGLVAAIPAVPTGVMDWGEIKKERPAWRLGLYHMMLNLLAIILWAVNFGVRIGTFREATVAGGAELSLSVLGTLVLCLSAYLGGLMVFDHGVGVARMSKEKWRQIAQEGNAAVPPGKEGQ
jgi:uncharacterized membrane protein